jgi:hypothetical protein
MLLVCFPLVTVLVVTFRPPLPFINISREIRRLLIDSLSTESDL